MDKYETIKQYPPARFKAVTGVSPTTFKAMLEAVATAYKESHKNRGRHRKLSCENMLLMTLEYYEEYRTQECIGASYGLHKTNVGEIIKWVENVLIKSGLFNLPGKKKLSQPTLEFEVIVVDTTETPVCRPKNNQRDYYSRKKNDTP